MRALLDVKVLIALLDPDHVFHARAHAWWKNQFTKGWASCPLTENGVVRIMANPTYRRAIKFHPQEVIERLNLFSDQSDHEFWTDNVSLLDKTVFVFDRLHIPRAITDIYLLALAVKHQGFLATFDQAIPTLSVRNFNSKNLCLI